MDHVSHYYLVFNLIPGSGCRIFEGGKIGLHAKKGVGPGGPALGQHRGLNGRSGPPPPQFAHRLY